MNYRIMVESDINLVVPLYIEYYNEIDGSNWTHETTYKRIHQVLTREDSYCLILEENSELIAFAMGYFEQYSDLVAYDLIEVVVALKYQNKGIGTSFMIELENRVKSLGASMIQLQSENDEMHAHFYGKFGFKKANNLFLMSKFIS